MLLGMATSPNQPSDNGASELLDTPDQEGPEFKLPPMPKDGKKATPEELKELL